MNLVIVQAQLSLLADFLDRVTAEVVQELSSIEERKLAGEFQSLDAYEHAVDYPFARIEIAARAVAYELVGLVESELHRLAHEPWLKSSMHKGPKNVQALARVNPEALTKLRMVSDLPFDQIVKLVESHFGLSFVDIEGWYEIGGLRHAVNAFKHRRGFKHPREIDWSSKNCTIPQRYAINRDQAAKAITDVGCFFRGLKRVLNSSDRPPPGGRTERRVRKAGRAG